MRLVISLWVPLAFLLAAPVRVVGPLVQLTQAQPQPAAPPPAVIDVNRPRRPEDCDLPIGISWYGSTSRCLQELCGGLNVYNEYIFDSSNRRRKNPCYGQSPTDFDHE